MLKNNKKIIHIIILIITLIIILYGFYKVNIINYEKQVEIKVNIVEHPESLPTKEAAKSTAFGFANLKADLYWLQAVQYIGGNAYHSEYKKYLFSMLDLITELNPYFEHPYEIGQLLLPSYSARYDLISEEEQENHTNEAIKLGLKGIENFCNIEKVERIKNEYDLYKIWTYDEKNKTDLYKNTCSSYTVPYYLAFVYFYYLKDHTEAAQYYKIASTVDDAPEGAKSMAAIMQGKGGDRQKAYFMFLNIANFVEQDNEVCQSFANQLKSIGNGVFYYNNFKIPQIPLNASLVKDVEKIRSQISEGLTKDESLEDTKCINYVNKATRELNLAYIDAAEVKYFEKYGKHSKNAKELYDKGFIKYFIKDFQQHEGYEIIYKFDEEIGKYNYEMGTY